MKNILFALLSFLPLSSYALDLNKVKCEYKGLSIRFEVPKEDFGRIGTVSGNDQPGIALTVILNDRRLPAHDLALNTASYPPVSIHTITLDKAFYQFNSFTINEANQSLRAEIVDGSGAREPMGCALK